MVRAIKHFARGAGAGPSGTRPDFLRQLVERTASSDVAKSMAAFCSLLAYGEAPDEVAPFMAGACGYAFRKEAKPGAPEAAAAVDARPVCSGEAWRRVIGNALLSIEPCGPKPLVSRDFVD